MSQRKSSYPSAAASIIAASCALASPAFVAGSLGGPLTLEDEGSFFVNGQSVRSEYPGASLVTGPDACREHHGQPDVRALPHPGGEEGRAAS